MLQIDKGSHEDGELKVLCQVGHWVHGSNVVWSTRWSAQLRWDTWESNKRGGAGAGGWGGGGCEPDQLHTAVKGTPSDWSQSRLKQSKQGQRCSSTAPFASSTWPVPSGHYATGGCGVVDSGMADLQFLGLLTPATAAAKCVHHPVWNWSPSDVVLVPYLCSQAPSIDCIACMQLTYRGPGCSLQCLLHTRHVEQQTAILSHRCQG